MGWNCWYVHFEGVSDTAIRETAVAMEAKGLTDHGWTYLNIDDCWMGLRDPKTKAILLNTKFGDIEALAEFVNASGLKRGLYSTPWMSTYAGYVGGSAPNKALGAQRGWHELDAGIAFVGGAATATL
jgi:alpha-galactosidase